MTTTAVEVRRSLIIRGTTASSPSSNNSHDNEDPVAGKVKQVIACCRRHIERFTRIEVYEESDGVNSSSCFELRRPKSNTLAQETHAVRTRPARPAPLELRQASYQFYMDEDNHPFITTPSYMEEGNSPRLIAFCTAHDMRLIDVRTIELRWFNDDQVPEYAILSHTWGPDEVSYQELVWINRIKAFSARYETPASSVASLSTVDESPPIMLTAMEFMLRSSTSFATDMSGFKEEDLLKRKGYFKIVNAAREAQNLGYTYIWIDTCCIDKSSSAELQEAINSMFRWYSDAQVCIVYLEDVRLPHAAPGEYLTASEIVKNAFDSSRWTKRGWTLQELVAPVICRFYLGDWRLLGEKEEFVQEISAATGIPVLVLEDCQSLNEVSVAERMSWAAHRQTTRIEDLAYCLLGLFDIQMPLLYGEGSKAFIRLQEEILKTTDDYSLFAWRAQDSIPSTYRGLLARSPFEFRDCHSIDREESISTFPINPTPIGLHLQLECLPHPNDKTRILALIRASNNLNQRLAITLKCLDGLEQHARVDTGTLIPINDWPTGTLTTLYVRQAPSIPAAFATPEFAAFHIQRRFATQKTPPVRILSVFPRELWDAETHALRIPESAPKAFGVILLRVQSHAYAHSLSFPVAFGFDRATCHYWIKAVPDYVAPEGLAARGGGAWQTVGGEA
ncbi:hypothetical protein E8E13_011137 [Curvularia kusanoi]|uniref:Heterokaryon incompatibility domain-containing protein n=1 Tax=Curvularia kusanoi TaxID=90978 RepID=A0A9P4TNT1_CURKU|nr:hypothetical protein E8E13_011137 [Curvularia kusanoi]